VPVGCRWPLHFQRDACFAGQLPCAAAPSFSQPQPYPLVLLQQAAPAQGCGAWMVRVWLDAGDADALRQAVEAQGGL
jgi:hypothetical protein